VKSLMSLWSCAADDLAARCCTSATRDIKTVSSRFEHEGLSFLAITLADFGKATQKWLDQGFVVPSDVPAFRRDRLTGLPVFMQGFLGRVFNPVSGVLLDDPCIDAIHAIRRLTLMFSKIALPESQDSGGDFRKVVTAKRERSAMHAFVQCEQEVRESDSLLDPQFLEDFKRMSNMLFADTFAKVDRDVYWGRLIPKHGPGAVADRLTSNGKFNQRAWPRRLQRCFPASEFMFSNQREYADYKHEIDFLEPGSEIPVRVITVPKTLKSPRVIAIEPTAMQYCQQALKRSLASALKEDDFLSRTIGSDDQTPNQRLARSGSLSGDLATLDLSEASDRVSNQHVRALFEDFPHLHEAVQSCRSRKADVPGHGVIRLAKFASMGSALCFPVEAMVFTTLIFLGIERELSSPLSRHQLIKLFDERVRVYGDDLIVPREHVLSVVDELSTFGYRVNAGKSYWTGRFRESCGREYYDGHDVSVVKVRRVLPTRQQDASGVISSVALRNLFYQDCEWQSAKWMDHYLGTLLSHFPDVGPSSPLLGRVTFLDLDSTYSTPKSGDRRSISKLDVHLHSPLVRGYKVQSRIPIDKLDGPGAMLKCLLRAPTFSRFALPINVEPNMALPSVDTDHLERSGRPEAVSIKLGWASPW